jgi:ComF family protein
MKRLAFDMGKAYARLVPSAFFEGMDAMIAVPLFFLRTMKRGYNQADFFARGIAKACEHTPVFLPNILVRKRPTQTQTKLSRTKRQGNVQGAFMVPKAKRSVIMNKNIIIVDDIVTTGATTCEGCLALKSAGCARVRVLSLARD